MDHKVGSVEEGIQTAANDFKARAERQLDLGQDVMTMLEQVYPTVLSSPSADLLIFHPPKTHNS